MKTRPKPHRLLTAAACAATLLGAPACGDDHEEHGESTEAEACEHLADGPFQAVSAAADQSGGLESINYPHTRVDVALVPVEGGNGGWVSFAADEDGDFGVFMDADVPLAVFDAGGDPVAFEASATGSAVCDAIGAVHTVELAVGTYALQLGPTSATTVGIVVEHLEGDH